MKSTLRTLMTSAAILATSAVLAPAAHAQMQWTDKGFANVSFGVQAPSHTLTTDTTFEIYGETASQIASQDVGGGAFFDISGGYKVWKNLAAGVGITFVGSTSDLIVNAQIPDPDFFDRPRAVSTTLTDAKHRQTAINLTGTWMMPVTDKIDVGFQFGPTIFLVSQDVPGTLHGHRARSDGHLGRARQGRPHDGRRALRHRRDLPHHPALRRRRARQRTAVGSVDIVGSSTMA